MTDKLIGIVIVYETTVFIKNKHYEVGKISNRNS